MAYGCVCSPLCDRCVVDVVGQLRGVAACRGEHWAGRVRGKCFPGTPWPPYTGKARTIARRLVADLTRDERALDALAEICHGWAAKMWADPPPRSHLFPFDAKPR